MKYTVIYKDTGDVLAVISEQPDIKNIKIDTFDIPDGNIIDSIDVSGKEHTAVTHATPIWPNCKRSLRRQIKGLKSLTARGPRKQKKCERPYLPMPQ